MLYIVYIVYIYIINKPTLASINAKNTMRKLATTRLEMLKDHLSNGGDLFLNGKRVAQVELRSSVNDCVFVRFEHEEKHFEINMFSLEFGFTTLQSAESFVKYI